MRPPLYLMHASMKKSYAFGRLGPVVSRGKVIKAKEDARSLDATHIEKILCFVFSIFLVRSADIQKHEQQSVRPLSLDIRFGE